MKTINPYWLKLPAKYDTTIHERTEAELLTIGPMNWRPVIIKDRVLVDGLTRVLVARKHGFMEIPCVQN